MGTGWRRAFRTTIPKDREATIADKQQQESQDQSPSLRRRSCAKLGFLSGGSNPFTPRLQSQPGNTPNLRCRTTVAAVQTSSDDGDSLISPKLQCKTTAPKSTGKSPRPHRGSNPSSPRSPFSILKNSLRLSFRNSCGVCLQRVKKTGQAMAIYTAECSHAFHFPCIAAHVRKNGDLVCPVCKATWRDVPFLAIHKTQQPQPPPTQQDELQLQANNAKPIPKPEERKQLSPPALITNLKTKYDRRQQNKQSDGRTYGDDEPLLSPTAGGGFIPIPEEAADDEVEEFQGFFVNPISSSSDEYAIGGGGGGEGLRTVEVSLMPEAAVVSVGPTHETYAVVLRVKAPPPRAHNSNSAHFPDRSRRAPIDLVTVLDVSGSMNGAKLQMLKRAMRLVVSSLGSTDRLSIVAFSACPQRLLPLTRMTVQGQRAARRIIDRLACSQGSSVVADALRQATKVLEDRRERNPVASVMLLSGGQDERVQSNNCSQRQVSTHVSSTRFAHIEIPVHMFGFREKGGCSREPADDAFTKCVGGLLSVVLQDLHIELGFSSGSDPAEISAVYSINGRPTLLSFKTVRLGDFYAEEEKELLVELRVPTPVFGYHHVLSVLCSYKDPATQEMINRPEQVLLVPRPQTVGSSMPKIEGLRHLFITTRAIAGARRLIEHSDLSSAHHLLASARALLMQSSSLSADEHIGDLEAELAELQWRRQYQRQQQRVAVVLANENGEPLTPTSARRVAERLAKVAIIKKKSMNRAGDLHGFENARF